MSMPIICHSSTTRCQAISDIIESVALQQTAISHILNAEGEKIHCVVTMPNINLDSIIKINNSAQSLVKTVTNLEIILQSKLSLFGDCLCKCRDEGCR
ncbi:MAG: hypothetical protein Q8873_06555 [Bacillota bacterium]|nr:hypothetical protein [Bacillota bacterium]